MPSIPRIMTLAGTTGTAGVFGAAAAAGKLLGLDAGAMARALGLAATQPVRLREMFGTMTKSFHPSRAAQNGLTAALLAARGFTSSEAAIEARRGWAHVTSTKQDFTRITEGLGHSYKILLNTYKPFACGIVIHPAIDGCLQLREGHQLAAEAIAGVALTVNPLVLELTGKHWPSTGLEGKFSVFHACAAAIVEGAAGESQFSDRAVHDTRIVAMRDRIDATVDPAMPADAADIHVSATGASRASSSRMPSATSTARDLEAKFLGPTADILPPSRARRVLDLCWSLANFPMPPNSRASPPWAGSRPRADEHGHLGPRRGPRFAR
jgi:2-methylcitrate dehydratase PrpD